MKKKIKVSEVRSFHSSDELGKKKKSDPQISHLRQETKHCSDYTVHQKTGNARDLHTGLGHQWKSSCPFQEAADYLSHCMKSNYSTCAKLLFVLPVPANNVTFKAFSTEQLQGRKINVLSVDATFRNIFPFSVLLFPYRLLTGPPVHYRNRSQFSWSHHFSLMGSENLILFF